jgi:ubiquinone biosynthesis protein
VVEGVARNLDPRLDMWTTSEPVVREWMERHLGPIGRVEETGKGLWTLAGLAADLPDMALRAKRILARVEDMTNDGMALHRDSVSAIGRAEARGNRWSTAALWIIAASLMIMAFGGF